MIAALANNEARTKDDFLNSELNIICTSLKMAVLFSTKSLEFTQAIKAMWGHTLAMAGLLPD
jgi:hypothetical protein